MTDFKDINKCRKDQELGVQTGPKYFLTNPPKKGEIEKGTKFGGKPEHLPDPIYHRKDLAKKEREEHLKKL